MATRDSGDGQIQSAKLERAWVLLHFSSEGKMFLSGFSLGNLINTRGNKLKTMTSPPIVLTTHYRMTSYLSLVLPTGYELV